MSHSVAETERSRQCVKDERENQHKMTSLKYGGPFHTQKAR